MGRVRKSGDYLELRCPTYGPTRLGGGARADLSGEPVVSGQRKEVNAASTGLYAVPNARAQFQKSSSARGQESRW
jgi:hypothetical protein